MIKIKCEYNILQHSLYHFSKCKGKNLSLNYTGCSRYPNEQIIFYLVHFLKDHSRRGVSPRKKVNFPSERSVFRGGADGFSL